MIAQSPSLEGVVNSLAFLPDQKTYVSSGFDGGVRAITVDGPAFHNLGASASWELAGAVAAGVAYLRLLGEAGLSLPDALRQISFRLAADDDQFMTVAKFRVLRRLWAALVRRERSGGVFCTPSIT